MKVKHWPFVESPGDFTKRLAAAANGPGGLLAGVREVLIEDPPEISESYLKAREYSEGRDPANII